jgi:hypothetical protein
LDHSSSNNSITEDTLWDSFRAALLNNHSSIPYTGFTQEHRDMLTRLKYRAFEFRIKKGLSFPDEECKGSSNDQ